MKRVCGALAIVATTIVIAGHLSAGGTLKSIAGDWEIVAMAKNGKSAPAEAVNAAFIRATVTTLVAIDKTTGAEAPSSKLSYEFAGPKDINFYEVKIQPGAKDAAGNPKSVKLLRPGIYEYNGETLKLSWSENVPGLLDAKTGKVLVEEQKMDRPKDFTGGIGQFSLTLKRKAK